MKLARFNNGPEIFHTIQGEGKSIGKPSIFVRTSLCNLHCVWCDTDYTWNWEGTPFTHHFDQRAGYKKYDKSEWIIDLPVENVVSQITRFKCQNVVLTGGEPLMHQKELIDLMSRLRSIDPNYWFEIETNCTLAPTQAFDELINQYNVSPKLSNSGNAQKLREKSGVYRHFAQNDKAVFKYVIDEQGDLEEVLSLIEKYQIDPNSIYLMPQGTSPDQLTSKQQWLIEVCKRHNFNYSDRLHIHIYGEKRGV